MKINNPFDRKEKRDFVPLSLFPINKTTRTSFQIGRATPVFNLDMVQGNTVKLNASELTRFASLSKPVMNNYTVTLRAFFTPYRALDGFFDSYYMNQFFKNRNGRNIDKILKADQFFDASRPDSTRVHPQKVKKSILAGTKLIGGLADHLGYRTYDEPLLDSTFYDYNEVNDFTLREYLPDVTYNTGSVNYNPVSHKYNWFMIYAEWDKLGYQIIDNVEYMQLPLAVLVALAYQSEVVILCNGNEYRVNAANAVNVFADVRNDAGDQGCTFDVSPELAALLVACGVYMSPNDIGRLPRYFGTVTADSCLSYAYNWTLSLWMSLLDANFSANVIRYLTYMRIYSDHFLPENFCKADDFRDIIGEAYMKALDDDNPVTLPELFGNSNSMYDAHTLKSYRFFQKYLMNGECLPVLWKKDYFTSLRPDISINGENRTDFKYSGNGVADTPVGATIREHYFNRVFQRFKDLIARLGYDSRKNASALYGFAEDDGSLRSSVSLSTHSFDVQIGDIAQTSENTVNGNLGQFAGFAVSRDSTGNWEWTAGTNGVFTIIAYIRPNGVAYASAVDRSILKDDYYDYLLPQFGGVGYQDVSEAEFSGSATRKIGNHEIYFEYMTMNNEVSGLMRTSMKDYGCDRFLRKINLANVNDISPLFITEKDEPNRVFNDTNEDTDPIVGCLYFKGSVTRQLPEHIELDF